jgi:hypothetical protein
MSDVVEYDELERVRKIKRRRFGKPQESTNARLEERLDMIAGEEDLLEEGFVRDGD